MEAHTPELPAQSCPLAQWVPEHGGYWRVDRYRDVRKVLADASRFSSMAAEIPRLNSADFVPPIPFDLDPPHHGEVRRVLDALLPRAVTDQLEPAVRASARTTAARLSAQAEFELMDDFAVPLVASGMWHLIGFREPDELSFIDQSKDLMRRMRDPSGTAHWGRDTTHVDTAGIPATPPGPPHSEQQSPPVLEQHILHAIQHGLGNQQGLLSALSRAEWRTYFTDRETEILGIIVGLTGTALANTVNVLVSAVDHLGTYPEDRLKLLNHRDQVASAVEEMLRLYPPQSPGRIAVRDTHLGGGQFRVGDSVLASVLGANRDSEVFVNPGNLVLDRPWNPHLAFGVGRHRCVGASFARMVIAVALDELHAVIPHYRISGRSAPVGDSPLRAPWKRLWVEPV